MRGEGGGKGKKRRRERGREREGGKKRESRIEGWRNGEGWTIEKKTDGKTLIPGLYIFCFVCLFTQDMASIWKKIPDLTYPVTAMFTG